MRNPTASYSKDLWDKFKPFRNLPVSTGSFWTVQVCNAFQGPLDEDHDPDEEGATLGMCTHFVGSTSAAFLLGSAYTGMAGVLEEVIRDLRGSYRYAHAVAHEVAHTLGCAHDPDDLEPICIMRATPAGEGSVGEWYSEKSIDELRDYIEP